MAGRNNIGYTGAAVLPLFLWLFIVSLYSLSDAAYAAMAAHHDSYTHTPTVGNNAIDTIDVEWWDDDKNLLFIDITFNFPVSVVTEVVDKPYKTHILQMVSTGNVARSYKHSYSGSEHHAISKRFRDFIEEIKYEGSKGGKSQLLLYLYEPAVLKYQMYNDFRTLHLEVSRLQKPKPALKPLP